MHLGAELHKINKPKTRLVSLEKRKERVHWSERREIRLQQVSEWKRAGTETGSGL